MSSKTISEMTSQEIFEAVDSGMKDVARKLESGEIDGSGRYFTDEQLAAGAATPAVSARAATTRTTAAD
jgi:hypothetical protein